VDSLSYASCSLTSLMLTSHLRKLHLNLNMYQSVPVVQVENPPWGGYEYFLEPHIAHLDNLSNEQ